MANRGFTYTDLEDQAGWAHLCTATESEIDDLAIEIQGLKAKTARIVRGQRCRSKDRLFQEIASALQFPHYFGENWDALEECLGDLGWIDSDHLTLLITNADKLLPSGSKDFSTFLEILHSVHDLEETVLERVVFQCDETKASSTRKRLEKILAEPDNEANRK